MSGKSRSTFERYPKLPTDSGKIFGDYQLDHEPHRLITPDRHNHNSLLFPATHLTSQERVMIKFDTSPPAKEGMDTDNFTQREFEVLTKLDHPNIPKVYKIIKAKLSKLDTREFDGLVMQLIDGTSLDEIMDFCRESGLSPNLPDVFHKLTKIAEALHYAHTQKYVHEDVKPGNIIIETATQSPYLIDWETAGKAGIKPKQLTPTLKYICPEKVNDFFNQKMGYHTMGGNYVSSPAGDTYSLAVLCYEIISGREPYDPITPTHYVPEIIDQLDKIAYEPYTKLSTIPLLQEQLESPVLQSLDELFTHALDKNPKSRLQDPRILISTVLEVITKSQIRTINYDDY